MSSLTWKPCRQLGLIKPGHITAASFSSWDLHMMEPSRKSLPFVWTQTRIYDDSGATSCVWPSHSIILSFSFFLSLSLSLSLSLRCFIVLHSFSLSHTLSLREISYAIYNYLLPLSLKLSLSLIELQIFLILNVNEFLFFHNLSNLQGLTSLRCRLSWSCSSLKLSWRGLSVSSAFFLI